MHCIFIYWAYLESIINKHNLAVVDSIPPVIALFLLSRQELGMLGSKKTDCMLCHPLLEEVIFVFHELVFASPMVDVVAVLVTKGCERPEWVSSHA